MLTTSAFAETAALMGDPARANMLGALMDGRALTASELARVAGVTAQTASGHLSRLVEAGLLAVERQGRHRYHRLASRAVATMLEGVMSFAADRPSSRKVRTGPRDLALRHARTCYDHLAGEVAVAIADGMQARGEIELAPDGGVLTEAGRHALDRLGMNVGGPEADARRGGGRVFCRPCLDWSERRPHIGGALGAAICRHSFERGWVRRIAGGRALAITPIGRRSLADAFGVRLDRVG